MSAPITHIVLADKVFDTHFSGMSKKEFLIGTSFPDIRYLGVIERDKTHFRNITLEDVKKADGFQAGFLFHSLVDGVRIKYMKSSGIYDLLSESRYLQPIKFAEDEQLYGKIDSWGEIVDMFESILQEELDFGIQEKDLRQWHTSYQKYFSKKPTPSQREILFKNANHPQDKVLDIEECVSNIRTNTKVKEIIENLYKDFDNLLK